ncbi:unnamed protein product (macronuclear) [Paramecium tetraurelia]|uniref:Ubiquitin-like domain-containing protein n=1 Tax=Paramecium tetraurelia TaxID=5888 RepID=A0DCB3_PARTE|nr:uncharacterized protein GSPATT00015558001 [Paramecium tetraurelia]CAK80680.1 unnamed protein product [Paramecium tetraurelia]|eukprot:XP_001448077.1 hypothetical protein (macronuclear) [Paramecium tetraurelia strain d4-2]
MIIYGAFDKKFSNNRINIKPFQIDISPNSTIEELKILITLQFTNLSLEDFDILNSQGVRQRDTSSVQALYQERQDVVQIFVTNSSNLNATCCNLI